MSRHQQQPTATPTRQGSGDTVAISTIDTRPDSGNFGCSMSSYYRKGDAPHDFNARTPAKQGLPPTIEDPGTLSRVALIFRFFKDPKAGRGAMGSPMGYPYTLRLPRNDRWTELADSNIHEVARLAMVGAQQYRQSWSVPDRGKMHEEFMRCLECRDHCYHALIITKPELPQPLDPADDADLYQRERVVSAEHTAYSMQARLKAALRTHLGIVARGGWTRLAELPKLAVRHCRPWDARGRRWA